MGRRPVPGLRQDIIGMTSEHLAEPGSKEVLGQDEERDKPTHGDHGESEGHTERAPSV